MTMRVTHKDDVENNLHIPPLQILGTIHPPIHPFLISA